MAHRDGGIKRRDADEGAALRDKGALALGRKDRGCGDEAVHRGKAWVIQKTEVNKVSDDLCES